jgi:hypothetical protein
MIESEAADVLTFCASFDNRTIGQGDVNAWAVTLGAVSEDEAREAIILHYRQSTKWIMPGDILRILREQAAHVPPRALPPPKLPDAGIAERGRAAVADAVRSARAEHKARRDRVLSFPDLAARLCRPPLPFTRPQHWNGFVPPRLGQDCERELLHSPAIDGGRPNQRHKMTAGRKDNDAAERTALVEICAEALRREREQEEVW